MGAEGGQGGQVHQDWVVVVAVVTVVMVAEGAMAWPARPDWMEVGAMGGAGSLVVRPECMARVGHRSRC